MFKVAAKTGFKQSRDQTPDCLKIWGLGPCSVIQKPQKEAAEELSFLGDDTGEYFSDSTSLTVSSTQLKIATTGNINEH